jgi:hypothetical protein
MALESNLLRNSIQRGRLNRHPCAEVNVKIYHDYGIPG